MKLTLAASLSLLLMTSIHADSPYNDTTFDGGPVQQIETPESDMLLAVEYYDRGQIKDATIINNGILKKHPQYQAAIALRKQLAKRHKANK